MSQWFLQLGLFAVIFALPCVLFMISRIVAEEMRDFFASSALSITVHLLTSAALALFVHRLLSMAVSDDLWLHYGLLIDASFTLAVGAWLLGASGCLYGDQAPSNRIGPRGIKRYR